jgi:hypothetical protein
MTTTASPRLNPDRTDIDAERSPTPRTRCGRQHPGTARRTESPQQPQGREHGSDPYDDATQGRKLGSDPHDDATQGRKLGSDPYDDATQGRTLGSDPYDDATQGRQIGRSSRR